MKKIILIISILSLTILSGCGVDNEEKAISENHAQNIKRIDAILKDKTKKPDFIYKNIEDFYDKLGVLSVTDYIDKIIVIKNTKGIEKREDTNSFFWEDTFTLGIGYCFEFFPKAKMTKLPKSIIGYYTINRGDWYESEEGVLYVQLHDVQEYKEGSGK